jgi:hypothetical protein
MKKEKCTALVYAPELTPEDVFSHLVNHHADVVRARNAQRAYKRYLERKHRCIASIVIIVSSLAAAATLLITSGVLATV